MTASRKQLLLAVIIVVTAGVITSLLYPRLDNSIDHKNRSTSNYGIRDAQSDRVFIKDLHKLGISNNSNTLRLIENTLYLRVIEKGPDLYTGIIRPESISKTTFNNLEATEALVDIEPINITYKIIVSKPRGGEAVDIVCPPQHQQITHSTECRDVDVL